MVFRVTHLMTFEFSETVELVKSNQQGLHQDARRYDQVNTIPGASYYFFHQTKELQQKPQSLIFFLRLQSTLWIQTHWNQRASVLLFKQLQSNDFELSFLKAATGRLLLLATMMGFGIDWLPWRIRLCLGKSATDLLGGVFHGSIHACDWQFFKQIT